MLATDMETDVPGQMVERRTPDGNALVEGDVGKLMFQGTRYLGFERR